MHPIVVDHADPVERKRRNVLRDVTRVTAAGDSLVRARKVVHPDRLAHQPVVAGDVQRDQRLDPRVAGILQLFVIGAVEIGLVGAESGGAPARFPNFLQCRVVRFERAAHFERIARVDAVQIFDDERRRSGFDVELDITIGFEPQRAEQPSVGSVGQELVRESAALAAVDFVAVSFAPFVEQRFGIGQFDFAAFASGYFQFRVGGGQESLVEQHGAFRAGRDFQRRPAVDERRQRCESLLPAHGGQALFGQFHHRDVARGQNPVAFAVTGRAVGFTGRKAGGRIPFRIVEADGFPSPRVFRAVDSVVAADVAGFRTVEQRREGFVSQDEPATVGVDIVFDGRIALYDQTGLPADLRSGATGSQVPYRDGQHVLARSQQRSDVDRFVIPAVQIAARRAPARFLSVDQQPVAVIGRDVDNEPLRFFRQVETFAEAVDAVIVRRKASVTDPLGAPGAGELPFAGLCRRQRRSGRPAADSHQEGK